MAAPIKIGVVGCGEGRAWVVGVRAGADTQAFALADLNQELARAVAEEYGVARVYDIGRIPRCCELSNAGITA